jgi:general secretion pathway protein E
MVATALWLYLTSWVSDDAKGNGMEYLKYTSFMLGAGSLGLLLALLVHAALVFLMLVLFSGTFSLYIVQRNKVVPDMVKFLGVHHRKQLIAKIPVLNKVAALRSKGKGARPALDLANEAGTSLSDLLKEDPSLSDGAVILSDLVLRAGSTKTRKVRLHPAGDQYVAQYVLDGVLYSVESFDAEAGRQALACASQLAGLSKGGRMRGGSGQISTEVPGLGQVKIQAEVIAAEGKPALALSFPDWTRDLYRSGLAGLGMHDTMIKRVRTALDQKRGALLVCSPAGSGRTTTLYAVAAMVDVFTTDLAVIEERAEHELEHVRHWTFGEDKPFTDIYGDVIREGPHVILLAEMQSSEQAEKTLEFAAGEGMLLTTLKAPDAPEALVQLVKLTGADDLVGRAVTCVVSQRLVRKVCPNCREQVEPAAELLKKLNIDPAKPGVWYKPVGCDACLNSGYQGRTGIFGMLILTEPVKKVLQGAGATAQAVRQAAGPAAFRTMYQDGVSKVVAGITTLDEVRRVLKGQ